MEDTIAIDGADKYFCANIYILFHGTDKWRIQGVSTPDFEAKPIIWPGFVENCMKMKEIGPRRGARP